MLHLNLNFMPVAQDAAPPPIPPPNAAQVDHPGVWERASHAYLNEVLTRRQGTPAGEGRRRPLPLPPPPRRLLCRCGAVPSRPAAVEPSPLPPCCPPCAALAVVLADLVRRLLLMVRGRSGCLWPAACGTDTRAGLLAF